MSYYSKVLFPFIQDLVLESNIDRDGHFNLSVDDLSDYNLRQFAAHILEYDEKDISDFVSENDISSSLIKILKKNNTENMIDFSEEVQEKLVEHYKTKMQNLVDDAIGFIEQEYHLERGSRLFEDRTNGETYWRHAS